MTVQFLPEAKAELADAAQYYELQQPGLGLEFLNEVQETSKRITESPGAFRRVSQFERRCRTRRFPYAVVYRLVEKTITIVAVMHLHRKPGYWSGR
jgi:plasmid stabilization system protein ParE